MTNTTTRRTVRDAIEALEAHRARLIADGRPPEWAEKAQGNIESLGGFDPDLPLLTVEEAAYGQHDWLTDVDRWAIKWQHSHNIALSDFETQLLRLIEVCDESNLARLAVPYYEAVTAVRDWRNADLADRLRGLPFDFSL